MHFLEPVYIQGRLCSFDPQTAPNNCCSITMFRLLAKRKSHGQNAVAFFRYVLDTCFGLNGVFELIFHR